MTHYTQAYIEEQLAAIQRVRELAENRKLGGVTGGCEYCLGIDEVLDALDGDK